MGSANKLTGFNDAKKVTKIDAGKLAQSNASNYAYSAWFYVDDWSYRYGEPKNNFRKIGQRFKYLVQSIILGAIENNLKIETTVYPSSQLLKNHSTHTCNVDNVPITKMGQRDC